MKCFINWQVVIGHVLTAVSLACYILALITKELREKSGVFHYGFWQFCVPGECRTINPDCQFALDTKLGNCIDFNASRAFGVIGTVFAFLTFLQAWYFTLRGSHRFATPTLSIIAGFTGMISFAIFADKGDTVIAGSEYGRSFALLTTAWCCAVAASPMWLWGSWNRRD